jgi:Fibronectin type III-like domain
MAQVKHLAVDNQETNRNADQNNVQISQRTEEEIYLPAFRAALQQADVASTMCSYSMINNAFACADVPLPVSVSGTVSNIGPVAGSDVTQLYLGDPASTGEPPRQLVSFQRVNLRPGQSAQVHFTIQPSQTWYWDEAADGAQREAGVTVTVSPS